MDNTCYCLFSFHFFILKTSYHFRSYLYDKTSCTLSFNGIYLQMTTNLVTVRKKKKLVLMKMKIVVGNFLHRIEFLKSIKASTFSNAPILTVLTQIAFCYSKYRKYLSQNSCGGHVFNKFEKCLPLVLSKVLPISLIHFFFLDYISTGIVSAC